VSEGPHKDLPHTQSRPGTLSMVEDNPLLSGVEAHTRESRPEYPRALLVAYHYPPCITSSGLHRSVCLSRDLQDFGWCPVVLTANSRAYRERRDDQLARVPKDIVVDRSFALDTLRHLGFRGRYLGWMAFPDPWVTWLIGAVPAGLRLIRKWRPKVIWSTYPIATAHLIAYALHRLTGVPWVADFRDPMIETDPDSGQKYPSDPRLYLVRQIVEEATIKQCQRAVFVTPGALRLYCERYPQKAGDMRLVGNGFDEESFAAAALPRNADPRDGRPLELVHSGILYPGPDRDANGLLAALSHLRQEDKISPDTLRIRLRATGYDEYYRERIAQHGVGDIVTLEPALPYQAALAEMMEADGLLLFQGSTSNPAVPAKLYEYLRARRPIFALVDDRGDTAAVLREARVGTIVPLDSREQIAAGLLQYLDEIRKGIAPIASEAEINRHSRKHKAYEMARVFEEVARTSGEERTAKTMMENEGV
jgi:glycosyltransferase involved in cell wall biosynthesis